MSEIKSRVFQYGDDCESDWPPKYGTSQGRGSFGYWDSNLKKFVEGAPPQRQKHGEGPYIIGDTIDKYYHPGACQWTDSRSKLKALDKDTGCITTDKKLPPDPSWQKQRQRERQEDSRKALFKSVAQIDAGTAPLTEETRQLCERQNELLSSALNFDAFNVAGKKNNAKGKRYKRRRKR